MTVLAANVLRRVSEVLEERMDLRDLEDWIVRTTWTSPQGADPEAEELMNKIELYFAEHTSGHRTRDDVLRMLGGLLRM
jgi:hypothetical protein